MARKMRVVNDRIKKKTFYKRLRGAILHSDEQPNDPLFVFFKWLIAFLTNEPYLKIFKFKYNKKIIN